MKRYTLIGFLKKKEEINWQQIHDEKGFIKANSIEEAYETLEKIFKDEYDFIIEINGVIGE